jgi:hypothetical protein
MVAIYNQGYMTIRAGNSSGFPIIQRERHFGFALSASQPDRTNIRRLKTEMVTYRHLSSLFGERKRGLTNRLNFSGSALASSCLKRSSLSRCFSLTDFFGFDVLVRGMLVA